MSAILYPGLFQLALPLVLGIILYQSWCSCCRYHAKRLDAAAMLPSRGKNKSSQKRPFGLRDMARRLAGLLGHTAETTPAIIDETPQQTRSWVRGQSPHWVHKVHNLTRPICHACSPTSPCRSNVALAQMNIYITL